MQVNIQEAKKAGYTVKVTYFDELNRKEATISLCSRIDPIQEGITWAKNIYRKDEQTFIVYGIGMGYHINALINLLEPYQRVVGLDVNLEVWEKIKAYSSIQELEGNQYEVLITEDLHQIEEVLLAIQEKQACIHMYYPCVKLIPYKLNQFKQILDLYKVRQSGNQTRTLVEENYRYNNENRYPNISSWYNTLKNKPVIIVSAGPSLDKNIDLLKEVNEEIFILATGRTLKLLIEKGIRVDMFCIIDPTEELMFKQIEGLANLQVPMAFLNTANHKVVKAYRGPKYIAYTEESPETQEGRIDSGGSVATVALELAIKFGANPIIFIGQDLAYTNLKSHCNNSISMSTIENGSITKKVKDIHGKYIPTTLALLSFKWWIEQKIRKTPGIKFINATEGGAYIEGCEHQTLAYVLLHYMSRRE